MTKTFEYKLYPSRPQERQLLAIVDGCRCFYNNCVEERKAAWEQEQRSVAVWQQLQKVKEVKQTNSGAKDIHSHILQVVATDVDKAYQAFFRRVKAGETPGYPRFKGYRRFNSFGLKEYGNGWKITGRRLRVFGVGRVAVRWHRSIEGTPKTIRIVRKADGWYACISCKIEQPITLPNTNKQIGLDVGINFLVTTSEGEHIENPRWYREEQAQLRIIQRRASRRKKGGSNQKKAYHQVALQQQHVARRREDYLDKLIHQLIQDYDVIYVEDLNILNITRNHHLSKSIMDAGWGYFIQHLIFKAEEAGRQVIKVNPAYTSQTCSACGERLPKKLPLSVRTVHCSCGLVLDRDENAALNILRAGRVLWELSLARAGLSQEAARL